MQGNFYNDAVIDPYMLERAEVMRRPISVLYGKSNPGGFAEYGQQASDYGAVGRKSSLNRTTGLFQTSFDFSDAIDGTAFILIRLTGLPAL